MPSPQLRGLVLALIVAGLALQAGLARAASPSLDDVHQAAEALAHVRAETARLESDWRWQRDTLAASIDVLQRRVDALRMDRELLEAKHASENKEIAGLAARTSAARALYASVEEELNALAQRIVAMRPWLPPRLALAVELPCRTLAESSLGASERMQHLSTVWSRCAQFNRGITYAEETLTPAGAANPRLVEVLYWGMSHAYALDRGAGSAYLGFPDKDGWRWEPRPEMTREVARLLAVYQDRADPEFVAVPAQAVDPGASREP